jgi:hypothetical protein
MSDHQCQISLLLVRDAAAGCFADLLRGYTYGEPPRTHLNLNLEGPFAVCTGERESDRTLYSVDAGTREIGRERLRRRRNLRTCRAT